MSYGAQKRHFVTNQDLCSGGAGGSALPADDCAPDIYTVADRCDNMTCFVKLFGARFMPGFAQFLKAIPDAASGPYALTAYLVTLAIWGFLSYRVVRNKNLLGKLELIPEHDRASLIIREMGAPLPPQLTAEQWIKSKNSNALMLCAIVALGCATLVGIIAIAKAKDQEAVIEGQRQLDRQVRRGQSMFGRTQFYVYTDFDMARPELRALASKD